MMVTSAEPAAEDEPDTAELLAALEIAAVEEPADGDLPFAAVDAPPRLMLLVATRLVATRSRWRPNAVEVFAVSRCPEQEAAEAAARARAFERISGTGRF